MFIQNFVYEYSYINQKWKIIKKYFIAIFYRFHYVAYKATACFYL